MSVEVPAKSLVFMTFTYTNEDNVANAQVTLTFSDAPNMDFYQAVNSTTIQSITSGNGIVLLAG